MLVSFSGWAQRGYGTLTYSIALPMGKTSDFTDKTSFRGVGLDYHYFLIPNFSLGASVGWNVFNQEVGRVTETYGDVTYTGNRFNYFNAIPIYVIPRYYFVPSLENSFSLYGGVGIGSVFARQTFDLGGLRSKTDDWQFALGPELGGIFNLPFGAGLNVNVRYNTGFESSDLPTSSYLGVNVGLVFKR
ncbi:MAG: porin family protein [Bacteroidota bacterium]|nr:porin family protein [Bacteroidota bacterium]